MSIDTQLPSGEMFTEQFDAKHQLGQAIDNILAIDQQGGSVEERRRAEDITFRAIHDFCDASGVRTDFEGKKARLSFALSIDDLIRQGSSLKDYDDLILQQLTDDISGDLSVLSGPDLQRFWAARKQPEPELHRLFSSQPNRLAKDSTTRPKNVVAPRKPEVTVETKASPKRRERLAAWIGKRITKKTVGAVMLTTALTVGAVFGLGKLRGNDTDETVPVTPSSIPEVTITIVDQLPTTTMPNNDTVQDVAINDDHTEEEALIPVSAPEVSQPPQDTVLTFAQGDNLWNQLQVMSVGTSGIEADRNDELNQAIAFALPFIAEANNTTVQDLNHVDIGQNIVIPEGIVDHLRTIGAR